MAEPSRREFLRRSGGAVGGAVLAASSGTLAFGQGAAPTASAAPGLGRNPLAPTIEQFGRDQVRRTSGWRPSGLTREAYLVTVGGIVRAFLPLQDARGAVIDAYERRETGCATPALALAAGVMATKAGSTDLLEAALRALDAGSAALAAETPREGRLDDPVLLLRLAERLLASSATAERRATWRRRLAAATPEAVAVEAALGRQLLCFTPAGLYRDEGDSLAREQAGRSSVGLLLDEGYAGASAAQLGELYDRGAWASLFLQSPRGEIATGGAGGALQRNEAAMVLACEIAARRFVRRGEHAGAGANKRAAHLALLALRRWMRPTGDLWIVKNRFDPALRHGYEAGAFHASDNLLVAAYLALAALAAEDRIPERPCPAEVGGFALLLQPAFHKAVLNAGGFYAEIETDGDPRFDPTGIVRVQHPQVDASLLSDGVAPSCAYHLPAPPTAGLAFGPAWRDAEGRWHALADHGARGGEAALTTAAASPDRLECELTLRGGLAGGASAVRESFFMTPTTFSVTATVDGDVLATRLVIPLLVGDGERRGSVELTDRRVVVRGADRTGFSFEVAGAGPAFVRRDRVEGTRVGLLDAAVIEMTGRTIRCVVRPLAAGTP